MSSVSYPVSHQRFSFEQVLLSILMGLLIFGIGLFFFIIGTQVWFAGRIVPGSMLLVSMWADCVLKKRLPR